MEGLKPSQPPAVKRPLQFQGPGYTSALNTHTKCIWGEELKPSQPPVVKRPLQFQGLGYTSALNTHTKCIWGEKP